MKARKDNILVNIVKKSVGLSSGPSNCCGTVPAANPALDSASPTSQESQPDASPAEPDESKPSTAEAGGCCG